VIAALRRVGVDVAEHHMPVWETTEHKWQTGAADAIRLAAAEARLLRAPRRDFDVLVVGYPGHFDLLAARRAARDRPIVFNPLVSLVDTFVHDRARFAVGSVGARVLEWIDRRALQAADLVVADTNANADRLAEIGALPRGRIAVCLVGAEERIFHPPWSPGGEFLFVGKLIPLHGLETILAAATLAPSVRLTIVGSGQLEHLLRQPPPNVRWIRWVDYDTLGVAYRGARCALGVFGTSDKAVRVIPNKVFQALACGTPVITADTPAARELLVDGESALLVPSGDANALAETLTRAATEPRLLERVATGGLQAFRERASEEVLGRCWREVVEQALR
jgi:glycosyltransferase involved in cell wall biosynthesis